MTPRVNNTNQMAGRGRGSGRGPAGRGPAGRGPSARAAGRGAGRGARGPGRGGTVGAGGRGGRGKGGRGNSGFTAPAKGTDLDEGLDECEQDPQGERGGSDGGIDRRQCRFCHCRLFVPTDAVAVVILWFSFLQYFLSFLCDKT